LYCRLVHGLALAITSGVPLAADPPADDDPPLEHAAVRDPAIIVTSNAQNHRRLALIFMADPFHAKAVSRTERAACAIDARPALIQGRRHNTENGPSMHGRRYTKQCSGCTIRWLAWTGHRSRSEMICVAAL
jgi:hypothetical protein